jgi:tetrahydromethanopterin S-methyltransferase subunit F
MTHAAAIRAMARARAGWPTGTRVRRPRVIAIGMMLAVAIGGAGLALRTVFEPPPAAQQMFEDIRYVAMFTGRDPDAAVRKAKLRVNLLMRDFGMSESRAAEYVARIMLEQSGGLCSGI